MLVPFNQIEPQVADATVRTFAIRGNDSIPDGEYGLLEMYCPKPDCDCRRVSLLVVRRGHASSCATISHAFVDGDLGPNDEVTYVDPTQRADAFAPALLELVESMLSEDTAYAHRLEEHYAMVKRAVRNPEHPCHAQLKATEHEAKEAPGSQLRPGAIGTAKCPVRVSVQTQDQLRKVAQAAADMNVHYIARMAPGEPMDTSEFGRIGQMPSAVPQNLSRHERRRWEKINRRRF